jgi:GH25 family lysozyme M1 (1,4-beta-N-acetylmuramidase)
MSLSWLFVLAPLSFVPSADGLGATGGSSFDSTPDPAPDLASDPAPDAVMGSGLGATMDVQISPPTQAATCASGAKLDGVDISKWNGAVDWAGVKAAGTDFAFVRVSDGTANFDPRFQENLTAARAAGIPTGVYQFFRPNVSATAQADLLLEKMGPLLPGDLPPVIDVEATGGMSKAQVTAAIHTWVDRVEGQLGVKPIIYSGRYFWQDNVGTSDFSNYPFWIAHYTNNCPNLPTQWSDWDFHQYTESGSVGGVSGAVDRNFFNGDAAALASLQFGGPAACGDGVCGAAESSESCFLDCPPCGVVSPDGLVYEEGVGCYQLNGPAEYWHESAGGHDGQFTWTSSTSNTVYNYASIDLFFEQAGSYDVQVHIPSGQAAAKTAKYQIVHSGGTETVSVDQSTADGWTQVATLQFAEGGNQSIRLEDKTGTSNQKIVFDAMRVVPEGSHPCGEGGGNRSADSADDPRDGLFVERGDDEAGCSVGRRGDAFGGVMALGGLLLLGLGRRRRLGRVASVMFAGGVAASTGCATDDGTGRAGTEDIEENDRNEASSCVGQCGGQAPGGCWCDEECAHNGDCCVDVEETCGFPFDCDPAAGDDGGAGDGGGGEGDGAPGDGVSACFLGADGSGTTCLTTVAGTHYNYPAPLNNNYRKPVRWIDVEAADLSVKVAPNFTLGEFAAPHKGQFQVLQPHAVAKIQQVREQIGALQVNSGYRSPTYNAQVGGATKSRHMYGDAFDVVPQSVSQQTLYNTCNQLGAGYTAKYASGHVHCDWRNVNVDTLFYGAAASSGDIPPVYTIDDLEAEVKMTNLGSLYVEATGYDSDEGELLNEWAAYDADDVLLAESSELKFVPPQGTVTVRVIVGGLAEVEYSVE